MHVKLLSVFVATMVSGCFIGDTRTNTSQSDADQEIDQNSESDADTDEQSPPDADLTDHDEPDGDLSHDADDPPETSEPTISFVSPENGATIPNPVTFRIAADGVDEVEVFADETYSLGPAWNPSERQTLLYRFAGTGFARSLHVVGRSGGADIVRADLTITVEPDTCEDLFFVTEFDSHNDDESGTVDLVTIREEALTALKDEVSGLRDCGATVSLGAMMSLLLYEGGFRVCAYNTRCEENSYNRTETDCDRDPEALYSYQFGLGAFHTSNFHPCRDRTYTNSMRRAFLEILEGAGFSTDESLLDADTISRFHEVCPDDTPNAVDYYILEAHDVFGIPRDGYGNYFFAYGEFPFFDPQASLRLTFRMLSGSCGSIYSDRDAIRIYGGGDSRYGTTARQNEILSLYQDFAAENCD